MINKIPSNRMPKYEVPKMKWYLAIIVWIFIILFVGSIVYKAYEDSEFRYVILILITIFIGINIIGDKKYERLKESRKDWDIGDFVKEFDLKVIDTWVVRAVYEAVYDEVDLPIKADDEIYKDLNIHMGDLEFDEILINVFQRTGRVVPEESATYDDIKTIRDLVNFFNKLPKKLDKDKC